MIINHGARAETPEYIAAEALIRMAVAAIPDISKSQEVILQVIPSCQCFGQNHQDVDILVLFADYRPKENRLVSSDGKTIHSFCLVVELKTHSSGAVEFRGQTCLVKYRDQLHDVTAQSNGQKYSVRNYISKNNKGNNPPWISNIIWLKNYASEMPRVETNILGADVTWNDFVNKIAFLDTRSTAMVETFPAKQHLDKIAEIFSKRLTPSTMERTKVERFTKAAFDRDKQKYIDKLAEQLLIFRGRGGTGKTLKLIQVAFHAYAKYGWRAILLTYNKALVADIERLLSIQGIRNSVGGRGIAVSTIHSFMHEWLSALGVVEKTSGDFLQQYEAYKSEALKWLRQGAVSPEDIERVKIVHSRNLSWDLVLIDEAQDWPKSERDFLYCLYGHKKIIIADGVDQFVRGIDGIDWREGIPTKESQIVPLERSLRVKSDLCKSIGLIADQLALNSWHLEPFWEMRGGKIEVVVGNALSESFHKRVHDKLKREGNKPIDMLLCVPPAWVNKSRDGEESQVARVYKQWGCQVWDAVDEEIRKEYPTSLEQFRIVQYDSCRGLEGWVVFCFALDEFFEYKRDAAESSNEARSSFFPEDSSTGIEYAKKWLMIPLTRAIDTLVLHVAKPESSIGKVLRSLCDEHPDRFQWIEHQ